MFIFEPGYYEWLLKKDDAIIESFGDFGERIWPEDEEGNEEDNIKSAAQDAIDVMFEDEKHKDLLPYKQDIYNVIIEGLTKYYL